MPYPRALLSLLPASLALLLAASPASAAEDSVIDRSVDTQLVYPALQPWSAVSIDSARAMQKMKPIFAAAWQLERMPLDVYLNGELNGPAIPSRNTLHMGGALSFNEWITASLRLAAVLQEKGDLEMTAPEHGFAIGDADIAVKAAVVRKDRFTFGPRIDLWVPSGTKDSWTGERNIRYQPTLLADGDIGPVHAMGMLGATVRGTTNTATDFLMASEMNLGAGALVPVHYRVKVLGEVTSRHGWKRFFQGGAENPIEAKVGTRILFPQKAQLDVAVGTGLSFGYGTSDLRVLVSLLRLPPAPEPEPEPIVVEIPPPKAVVKIEEVPDEPEVKWQEGQLAQIHKGKIIIKDPIQFEFATPIILPESYPVLEAVAQVLTDYGQIEHLVIEGHASEEGTDKYNYDLSTSRAESVFKSLVERGIHPDRLSYRGLGETVRVTAGTDEAALARNRRVEFKILKVRDYLEVSAQDSGGSILIPWTGEAKALPKAGDKMLSADANPVLMEEVIKAPPPTQATETKPEQFLNALQEGDNDDPFLRNTVRRPTTLEDAPDSEPQEGTTNPPASDPGTSSDKDKSEGTEEEK